MVIRTWVTPAVPLCHIPKVSHEVPYQGGVSAALGGTPSEAKVLSWQQATHGDMVGRGLSFILDGPAYRTTWLMHQFSPWVPTFSCLQKILMWLSRQSLALLNCRQIVLPDPSWTVWWGHDKLCQSQGDLAVEGDLQRQWEEVVPISASQKGNRHFVLKFCFLCCSFQPCRECCALFSCRKSLSRLEN